MTTAHLSFCVKVTPSPLNEILQKKLSWGNSDEHKSEIEPPIRDTVLEHSHPRAKAVRGAGGAGAPGALQKRQKLQKGLGLQDIRERRCLQKLFVLNLVVTSPFKR